MSGDLGRRSFLRAATVATGAAVLGGSLWREAAAAPAVPGPTHYGPLRPPNADGLALPEGFTSRVVARSGRPVGPTGYLWHPAPDGGACFPSPHGWTYVSNSEVVRDGGASAIRFDGSGQVRSAYRILSGTRVNCAGGATPWGRWLSCEEVDRGWVWDADPTRGDASGPPRRDGSLQARGRRRRPGRARRLPHRGRAGRLLLPLPPLPLAGPGPGRPRRPHQRLQVGAAPRPVGRDDADAAPGA